MKSTTVAAMVAGSFMDGLGLGWIGATSQQVGLSTDWRARALDFWAEDDGVVVCHGWVPRLWLGGSLVIDELMRV
jgi:hypothetical protein